MFEWLKKIFHRSYMNERIHPVKGAYFNQVEISESEFIKMVPVGNFPNHPDGAHEITPAHIQEMEKNFSNTKKDMLVDYEHGSLFGRSRAAGWSAEMQARSDGLYVKYPSFTPAAKEMIANREFRYFSPVYFLKTEDKLGRQIGATLHSVAMTNIPYMDNEIDHIKNDSSENTMDKNLLKLLGLAETATQADVDAKLAALRGQFKLDANATLDDIVKAASSTGSDTGKKTEGEGDANPAGEVKPKDGTPVALTEAEVDKRVKDGVKEALVERDAEVMVNSAIYDGKILPAEKNVWLNSAKADLAQTKILLDARPKSGALPGKMRLNYSTKQGDKPNARDEFVQEFRSRMPGA